MDYLLPIDRLIISIIVGIIIGLISCVFLFFSSMLLNFIKNKLIKKRVYKLYSINKILKIIIIGYFVVRLIIRLMFPDLFNGSLSIYNTITYIFEPITLFIMTTLHKKSYKKVIYTPI